MPVIKIKNKSEKRIGIKRRPKGEKFNIMPIIGIIAKERAKLYTNRSILSTPLSPFFDGKRRNVSIFPGIKRRIGNPRIIRNISFASNNNIGIRIIQKKN